MVSLVQQTALTLGILCGLVALASGAAALWLHFTAGIDSLLGAVCILAAVAAILLIAVGVL